MISFVVLLWVTFIVLCWVMFAVMVGIMASKRGRSVGGWVALSMLIISPLIGMIFLLILGETEEKKIERITAEEILRQEVRGLRLKQKFKIDQCNPSSVCELMENIITDNKRVLTNRKITCYANKQTYENLCKIALKMQYSSGDIPYFQMKSGKLVGISEDDSLADNMAEMRFELKEMFL